ncbi:WD40 repeat domain-containing protein [Pseudonocardia sp. TRM90224]|uniref:WD40 repeat domain-containing protein n=1 Tax=Pseudonocardia sp. TRM90224 TaxID=2812678 RepID=UPI001E2EF584|nr:WD40 repeat domain-containing protein [Pseudonocardia sp. TRM90224]
MRLRPGFRIGSSFQARFDDQGARLATIGHRGAVWDVANRQKIGFFRQLKHTAHVGLSPDGSLLVSKNTAGDVLLISVPTLTEHMRMPGARYGEGSDIHFSPCGRYIIDGSWSGHLTVRDVDTGAVAWEEYVEDTRIGSITHSCDRQTWAYTRSVPDDRPMTEVLVREWPFADNQPRLVTRTRLLKAIAIHSNGPRVAVEGTTTPLQIWSLDQPEPDRQHAAAPNSIHAMSWAPDGAHLALSTDSGLRVLTADLELAFEQKLEYPSDVDWSPDGRLIAAGDWGRGIALAWPPTVGA